MEYGFSSQVHILSVLCFCVRQMTRFSYFDEGAWSRCFVYVAYGL